MAWKHGQPIAASLERYHQCPQHHVAWQTNKQQCLEEANVTSVESYIIKKQLGWASHLVRTEYPDSQRKSCTVN